MPVLDAEGALQPLGRSDKTEAVAGDASEGVARRGGEEEEPGVDAHGDEGYHDGLAAEGEDAACQKGGEEHAPETIADEEL